MSNDITLPQSGQFIDPASISDARAMFLQKTVWVGASMEMVKIADAYCMHYGVDAVMRPVYIIPYSKRDRSGAVIGKTESIIPGIGLYRIIAARSGSCGNDVVYGPEINGIPEWIEYTAFRLMSNGTIAKFTAREYMKENMPASRRPDSKWNTRPVGMLRIRAESQALRMGFPEVGAQPTIEEIEEDDDRFGDNMTPTEAAVSSPRRKSKAAESLPPPEEVHAPITEIKQALTTPAEADIVDAVETGATKSITRTAPAPTSGVAPGQIAYIRGKLKAAGRDVAWLSDHVGYQLADDLSNMTADAFNDAKRALL